MADLVPPATGPAGKGRLVSLDADGGATVEREGATPRHPLHRGLRVGHLGPLPPNPELMLIAFEGGGLAPDPAEAVLLTAISADGLEALARDLLAAVADHRRGRAIDMRFLV